MADSNITKQALASALKELVTAESFEKVSVSDICDKCHMNRKSFYYHFRDKYELANWIFDTEIISLIQSNSLKQLKDSTAYKDRWHALRMVCDYFYENRVFYRKLLAVECQNSLSSHIRDFYYPIIRVQIQELIDQENVPQMVYDFIVDGVIAAMERWLTDRHCIPPEEFTANLKILLKIMVAGIGKRESLDPHWLDLLI